MAGQQEMQTAIVNRSIRTIKAELEFLTDASVITPQTLNQLLSAIPEQTALHAPISVGAVPTAMPAVGAPQPPPMQNLSMNEKQDYRASSPAPPAPPPAYGAPPGPPPTQAPLAQATALYDYRGEDPGDLDLQHNDQIFITEYTNAEWWTGRSGRTGRTGIFPRSYVRLDEKQPMQNNSANNYGNAPLQNTASNYGNAPLQNTASNYGNAPLQVSGMGNGESAAPSKGQEMGKKFGKKIGNAAIFGAGATIGSNIVNSIF